MTVGNCWWTKPHSVNIQNSAGHRQHTYILAALAGCCFSASLQVAAWRWVSGSQRLTMAQQQPASARRLVAVSRQVCPCGSAAAAAPEPPQRKRLALVATTIWRSSHAQHLADRFGMGYARDGRWHRPDFDVVSMFVDQPPDNPAKANLAPLRAAEFGSTIYPTIAEALRCGGDTLAVDAVLIVGEHGVYGSNQFDQHMYPRYEFFKAVTAVFRADGRTTPVFSDKHLSYDYDKAVEMVEISKELGFAFLAGSSVPCGYRMPALELSQGVDLHEALVVTNFGGDGGWFHGLEVQQSMAERRRGGETGVASVHATVGDDVWPLLDAALDHGRGSWDEGGFDAALLEGCLCRSQQLRNVEEMDSKPADGTGEETSSREPMYSWRYPSAAEARSVVDECRLIRILYRDGTRASVLFLAGLVAIHLYYM